MSPLADDDAAAEAGAGALGVGRGRTGGEPARRRPALGPAEAGHLDQDDGRLDLVVHHLRERGGRRHRRQRLIDVRLDVLRRERRRTLGDRAVQGDGKERRGDSRAEQAPPPSTCPDAGPIDRATPSAAWLPSGWSMRSTFSTPRRALSAEFRSEP